MLTSFVVEFHAPRWGAIKNTKNEEGGVEVKILLIIEWNNPKEEAKLKKYYASTFGGTFRKMVQEDSINVKDSRWTDGTGHMV